MNKLKIKVDVDPHKANYRLGAKRTWVPYFMRQQNGGGSKTQRQQYRNPTSRTGSLRIHFSLSMSELMSVQFFPVLQYI